MGHDRAQHVESAAAASSLLSAAAASHLAVYDLIYQHCRLVINFQKQHYLHLLPFESRHFYMQE